MGKEGKFAKKNLLDLSLMEILELKAMITRAYGEGIFDRVIGEEIAELLQFVDKGESQLSLSKVKDEQRNPAVSRTKTFAEILSNHKGSGVDTKHRMIDENAVPLKPLYNPKMVGGNVVVEVDDDDYRRGLRSLNSMLLGC